jgi:hypothetical protein
MRWAHGTWPTVHGTASADIRAPRAAFDTDGHNNLLLEIWCDMPGQLLLAEPLGDRNETHCVQRNELRPITEASVPWRTRPMNRPMISHLVNRSSSISSARPHSTTAALASQPSQSPALRVSFCRRARGGITMSRNLDIRHRLAPARASVFPINGCVHSSPPAAGAWRAPDVAVD